MMRAPRFRVRTLMAAVGLVAVLVWAVMMGLRSYIYYRLASHYHREAHVWIRSTARGDWRPEVGAECVEYFGQLAGKYDRAMWRPWRPIAPDPPAPGAEAYLEQERRKAADSRSGR